MRPSGVCSLCESSTARWLARSTPRCRYVRLPSGASSTSSTKSSVSGAVLCTNSVAVIGPAIAVSVATGSLRYVSSSGPRPSSRGGPTSPPAWYDQNCRFVPVHVRLRRLRRGRRGGRQASRRRAGTSRSSWCRAAGRSCASLRPFGTSAPSVCVASRLLVRLEQNADRRARPASRSRTRRSRRAPTGRATPYGRCGCRRTP